MTIGAELAYSKRYSAGERLYIKLFGVPINGLRIRARRIVPYITKKYKNILDAGCGPGVFSFHISGMLPATQVTGIDIDADLVKEDAEIASALHRTNCRFLQADILNLTEKETYDLIVSIDNLEHIQNDALALKKFFSAAAPGGDLILHVPGLYRRWPVFAWKTNFYVKGHFRPGYTKEGIEQLVKTAGFKIKEAYYTYGWLETITNNISYAITSAEMKHKYVYALVFPFLNAVSFFGRKSRPTKGGGVFLLATKPD